jgi:hypothetical protein
MQPEENDNSAIVTNHLEASRNAARTYHRSSTAITVITDSYSTSPNASLSPASLYANPLSSPQNPLHHSLQHTVRPLPSLEIESTTADTTNESGRSSPFRLRNDDNSWFLRRCCCSVWKALTRRCDECMQRCGPNAVAIMVFACAFFVVLVLAMTATIVAIAHSSRRQHQQHHHKQQSHVNTETGSYRNTETDNWEYLVRDYRPR